jgi:lysylphosphatidylglycerol synthetase-like protein (DUF2156 family)
MSHVAGDPTCHMFEAKSCELPFVLMGRCAVVFGDPLGEPRDWEDVGEAFASLCQEKGWVAVHVASKQPRHAPDEASFAFGALVFADPQHDPEAGHAGRHLRQNLNHVRRLGLTVREYLGVPEDAELEARVQATCDRWCKAHRKPSMFLGKPRLFTERAGRRWFVAEQGREVVGMLSLLRAGNLDGGRLVNLVFAAPDAPPHTTDLLVSALLRQLRGEGATRVCLGLAPRSELGEMEGFSSVSSTLAPPIYRMSTRVMHLEGLGSYWTKFGVVREEPVFVRFRPGRIGMRQLYGLARALHLAV